MNVLKKYTWLVGTLMRAGDKGLTLEQIGDRWNATEELHEEAKAMLDRYKEDEQKPPQPPIRAIVPNPALPVRKSESQNAKH